MWRPCLESHVPYPKFAVFIPLADGGLNSSDVLGPALLLLRQRLQVHGCQVHGCRNELAAASLIEI
jgi:hypothetical protein